eukprot:g7016.t1
MVYNLKRLLSECSKRKWRVRRLKKNVPDDKEKVLEECWAALNLWILSSLEKGKGANIPNFCRFSWEIVYDFEGKVKKYKPNFKLADSFCRAYGVKNWKAKAPADTTTPLDINFTEIAIRWSAILTKDMAFAGLRDIFQRLGQILSSGRPVKIRFGCGKFLSKDRKIAFVFDQDLQVKTKKGLRDLYEKSLLKKNSQRFSVTDDAEILELLDASSEVGSTMSQNLSIPSPGPNAFVPLPKMSTTGSINGDDLKPLNSTGEGDDIFVPQLPLSNLSSKGNGEGVQPQQEQDDKEEKAEQKSTVVKNTQIPPLVPKKQRSKSTSNILDPKLYVEESRAPDDVQDRKSRLSARRGLQLIEEDNLLSQRSRWTEDNPETTDNHAAAETGMLFAVSSKYKDGVFGKERGLGDINAQQAVMDQAYKRHMAQTENFIEGEEKEVQIWRDQLWERELEYRTAMKKRRDDLRELTNFIKNQIEYNQKIRADEAGNNKPVSAYPDLHRFQKLARKYGVGKVRPQTSGGGFGSARSMKSTDSVDSNYLTRVRGQQLGEIIRRQIEDKMAAMKRQRELELRDGRRFINHVNAAAREQQRKMNLEKERVKNNLMQAWDRDTHTRNMILNRRKKMKKGGILFGPDGEIITGSTYKSPSTGGIFGGNDENDKVKKKGKSEEKKIVEKPKVSQIQQQLPQVPKDISVGFDMRSAR